ncbi:Hsp70 family protein [uncultured Nevskia sp.]|uniref:Hsp70 family protein n=1 Tax=uncultured Nevskia sp. TaxID=228950 RepID=UPI0025D92F2E|nr:Hsp70 family protein [uncultured Nevskia sp.]
MTSYAAIDFGTSNSAVCIGTAENRSEGAHLVPLEGERETLPTAVFFNADEHHVAYGRQAISEYQAGYGGRLMRSLKSLLGSELINETTIIEGQPVAYRDIISRFLNHLKRCAEAAAGGELSHVVLGRPVHFVDDNPERDQLAETTLRELAEAVGFRDVRFQYEPIAAALDYERTLDRDRLVLVADIGGGTSDFSVVRLGPERAQRLDRSEDVLANGGIHIAGTDFDQYLSLRSAMTCLGLGARGRGGKQVPSQIYFELSTWHQINFLYTRKALASAATLDIFYDQAVHHQRLMKVLREREGHRIAGLVEDAKVQVAEGGSTRLDLDFIEAGLGIDVDGELLARAIEVAIDKIVQTAVATVADAGLTPEAIDAIYFTGGSTGIRALREALSAAFAKADAVNGDPFASVARGLGVYAARLFSAA